MVLRYYDYAVDQPGSLESPPCADARQGHLFFFAIEESWKPVSIRIRQAAAYVGLSFIILLMLMVFKNDLERVLDVWYDEHAFLDPRG